jgi:hypothetical protein
MNVTSPVNTYGTSAATQTLPIKRDTTSTVTPSTPLTPPSNPPHLGNTIDTTA